MTARKTYTRGTLSMLLTIPLFLFALACLSIGITNFTQDPNAPSVCQGQDMQPGNTCEITYNGTVTYRSYQDMHQIVLDNYQSNHQQAPLVIMFGLLFLLGGIVLLVSGLRARHAEKYPPLDWDDEE